MKKTLVFAVAGALLATAGISQARTGEEIYKTKCFVCHMTGAAGAPKLEDKAAWAPRLATGLDALVASVTNGKNAMPPMGTCTDCNPEELKAAVEYMIDQAAK